MKNLNHEEFVREFSFHVPWIFWRTTKNFFSPLEEGLGLFEGQCTEEEQLQSLVEFLLIDHPD